MLAPKPLVLQGLQFFDQSGFQQQGADFSSGLPVLDPLRLAQHPGFFRCAQVRKQSTADIDAFADVERYRIALSVEEIHPGCSRSGLNLSAQVRRVFIHKVGAGCGGGHAGAFVVDLGI